MVQNQVTLRRLARQTLRSRPLVVVSNREPYIHTRHNDGVTVMRPASGMVVALDPVLRACGGLWVAHGSGNADQQTSDARGHVPVPPENPAYTLRRVWLSKEQEEGYYYGFSNSGLWPLCHIAYRRPIFEKSHWDTYREVNELFAQSIAEEIGDQPAFVFVQDYHLALLPRMLKERNPNVIVALFWHIPWPNPEAFRICPWKKALLEGLLGCDILGFHVRYHCNNFIDTVDRELEALPDREMTAVVYGGHITKVRSFPISVDFAAITAAADTPQVARLMKQWRAKYKLPRNNIGIGVDRLDYTKGIPERLRAIDRFLENHPEYVGNFVFVQIGVPSRTHVAEYRKLGEEVEEIVGQINRKHRKGVWKPIVYLAEHHEPPDIYALYRLARFCIVSSLHDGMNLVAKEFVSANIKEEGVLLLSRFTGAARQLRQAMIINPYAVDELSESIYTALTMSDKEVQARMRRLRETVRENNIYKWAESILRKLSRLA